MNAEPPFPDSGKRGFPALALRRGSVDVSSYVPNCDHHILELEGCLVVSQTGASQTAVHTVPW